MTAHALAVEDLYATFPNGNGGLRALAGISFTIEPREFVCVLGPSGSGKSTLLRILADLLEPTCGRVRFYNAAGEESPSRIGYVFQQANLMPWRTVLQNITLPLELQGAARSEANERARDLVELIGLQGFEENYPRDLSGGMAQRVAIARALIHDPDVLLLDEPFGALDALTRERMGGELLRIWQARQKTVLMVTHSISEALFLSDRVIALTARPGRIALDMPVPLHRPRLEDMRYTPQFGALANTLRAAIG